MLKFNKTYDLINYTETNYRSIITKIEHVNSYFRKNSVEFKK